MLPSPVAEPERYQGRPLLVLIENYVLDTIDALSPENQAGMAKIVRRAFGEGDDWRKTIRDTLQLDASIDENLRSMWAKNRETAREQGIDLHPVQFARMVVDQNFIHLIDKLRG